MGVGGPATAGWGARGRRRRGRGHERRCLLSWLAGVVVVTAAWLWWPALPLQRLPMFFFWKIVCRVLL